MKFRDLLENGFISDKDTVVIRLVINDESKKLVGSWYEDGILNCMDFAVNRMSCEQEYRSIGRRWDIELYAERTTQEQIAEQNKYAETCVAQHRNPFSAASHSVAPPEADDV